jgi:hypothetical protein
LNGAKRLNDWNGSNGLIPVMNGAQRLNPSIDSGQASGTFGTGASQNSPELYERSSRDHKQNQLAAHAGFSASAASITPLHAIATGEK